MTTVALVVGRRDTGESLQSLLSRAMAADVHLFTDYSAAVATLGHSVVDLLVIDVGGQDAPGIRLIRGVRSNLRMRLTPIIAMTTGCFRETEQKAVYEAGASVVLSIPIAFDELNREAAKLLHLTTDPDLAMIYSGVETQGFDYKEAINLQTKEGAASLAKDVIAMANWGGGIIIVGFKEVRPGEFDPIGVTPDALPLFEPTRLNKTLGDFLDPPVAVNVRRISDGKFTFICLAVPGSSEDLIFARKENAAAGLFKGRIYSRTSRMESGQLESADEIRRLIIRIYREGNPTMTHDPKQVVRESVRASVT